MSEAAAPWRELPRPWIADIGSGGDPWPLANILVDKFVDDATIHRGTHLHTDGKLLIEADVAHLPFGDNELDWVRCSHVLEHSDNPPAALAELQRVCVRGEVWVPTIHAEAAWRIISKDCKPSGHRWLCARLDYNSIGFMQYADLTHEISKEILGHFVHLDQTARFGYGAELRIAWGWGSWPPTVGGVIFALQDSKVREFVQKLAAEEYETGAVAPEKGAVLI